MNVFIFDIETVPDVESGRCLFGQDPEIMRSLSDEDVARIMFHQRQQETDGKSDFLRHHLQKIVAISVVLRSQNQFKVWSLGEHNSSEAELLERFFAGIEKYSPTLVSWNGNTFDLPVLHYRALLHGIPTAHYWAKNYLYRYGQQHIDLMDLLANYQPNAFVSLDQIATMLGFPGKMGMEGGKVWESYLAGQIEAIRQYCETDVLNTYLVYLRFELMRGHLKPSDYAEECQLMREKLLSENKPHLNDFVAAIQNTTLFSPNS